jgi:hypothetical protein
MYASTLETGGDSKDGAGFRAPLFGELFARLECVDRRIFLELGPLTGGTLSLLRGFRSCLVVADAAEALASLSGESADPAWLDQRLAAVLPQTLDEPVDAVFCWDLLNHLSPPMLAALGRGLSRIVRPGGLAHALIQAGGVTMPERPARYTAISANELACRDPLAASRRPSPRYTPWDLEKHCGTLKVDRSVLLRNGMQEYLLRIESESSAPREIPSLYRTSR